MTSFLQPRFVAALLSLAIVASCDAVPVTVGQTHPAVTEPTASSGDIEQNSGINKNALLAIQAMGSQIGVFYYPDRIDPAQKAAAPARLCASRGQQLESFRDAELHHPEEMPGAMHLVIYCH